MIWFAIVLAAAVGIAFIPFAKMQARHTIPGCVVAEALL